MYVDVWLDELGNMGRNAKSWTNKSVQHAFLIISTKLEFQSFHFIIHIKSKQWRYFEFVRKLSKDAEKHNCKNAYNEIVHDEN